MRHGWWSSVGGVGALLWAGPGGAQLVSKERAMRHGWWSIVVGGVVGALLWAGQSGAQLFSNELHACRLQLSTCNNSLQPCETDLQACQADSPHFFGDELDAQVGVRFSFRINNDGTFTDLNTGLIWERKNVNNQSINIQFPISVLNFDTYLWYTAVAGYLVAWNDFHSGEWRFPTLKELLTLVDYSKPYVFGSVPDVIPGLNPTGSNAPT